MPDRIDAWTHIFPKAYFEVRLVRGWGLEMPRLNDSPRAAAADV
jgi:hypothetical protein